MGRGARRVVTCPSPALGAVVSPWAAGRVPSDLSFLPNKVVLFRAYGRREQRKRSAGSPALRASTRRHYRLLAHALVADEVGVHPTGAFCDRAVVLWSRGGRTIHLRWLT